MIFALIAGVVVALVIFAAALSRPPDTPESRQPTGNSSTGGTSAPGPSTSTTDGTPDDGTYMNENYTAPPPDTDPPPPVYAANDAEAKRYLSRNPLYQQVAPRPIRCKLSEINLTTATTAQLQQHLDQLTACLMKEWDGVLKAAGFVAVRPTVTVYSHTIQTACGKAETRNAFYCMGDQQVYFASDISEVLPPTLAVTRLPVDLIMAHEFGHAIQARVGILGSTALLEQQFTKSQALAASRRAELQADCFAGLYLGGVARAMQLTANDQATISALLKSIGDDTLAQDPDIVGDHGRSTSRQYWGNLGIKASPALIETCNTWVAPESRIR